MRIIERANQRIHERSRAETPARRHGHDGHRRLRRRGLGHDRARRRLALLPASATASCERLTVDHSLVGDLVRLGKLTEEQAESHPQRSVITRALGPEPNVQVDVEDFERQGRRPVPGLLGRPDVDGPRGQAQAAAGRARAARWRQLGRELIAAANAAGGRDNITVILFTLEEVDAPAAGQSQAAAGVGVLDEDTREYHTFVGRGGRRAAPGRQPPAGPHAPLGRGAAPPSATRSAPRDAAEAEYRASGTVALSAVRPRAQPIEEGHPHAPPREQPRRRSRARLVLARQADRPQLPDRPRGRLLARDAPGLLRRRRRVPRQRRHPVQGPSVRPPARDPALLAGPPLRRHPAERAGRRRATFTDHKLRSKDDAEGLVKALEDGRYRK